MSKRFFHTALTFAIVFILNISFILPAWSCSECSIHKNKPFQSGVNAAKNQQYEQAIELFTQAIAQEDHPSSAYSNRCMMQNALENYEAAIADCTVALIRDSGQSEAYLNRGLAYYRTGNYQAAIRDDDRLIKHNPQDFRGYLNRGLVQVALGQAQLALIDYDRAVDYSLSASAIDRSEIYTERALSHWTLQNQKAALGDLSQALSLNSDNSRAYYNRGYIEGQQGDFKAAFIDLDQAIALDSENADARLSRGIAAYQLGKMTIAQADFQYVSQLFWSQGNISAYEQVEGMLGLLQEKTESITG